MAEATRLISITHLLLEQRCSGSNDCNVSKFLLALWASSPMQGFDASNLAGLGDVIIPQKKPKRSQCTREPTALGGVSEFGQLRAEFACQYSGRSVADAVSRALGGCGPIIE